MTGLDWVQGVLDTSTVILLPRLRDPELLSTAPLITVVTLAELLRGRSSRATTRSEQPARARLQQAETDFDPIPLMPRRLARFLPAPAPLG